jgi:hypothetical protein
VKEVERVAWEELGEALANRGWKCSEWPRPGGLVGVDGVGHRVHRWDEVEMAVSRHAGRNMLGELHDLGA